jgi:hypothetical protein
MVTRIASALAQPGNGMSWAQLGAATVFVIAVALMWRQVTLYIMREI